MRLARYAGPTNSLAIHRVATHLIPPGGYGYDIAKLRPLVNGEPLRAPDLEGRNFNSLRLPTGYGTLLLGGDIRGHKSGRVARRFVDSSGGRGARLVVLATGYAESAAAQADASAYAQAFQANVDAPVEWFVLDAGADQAAIQQSIAGATGIFLTAPDQSLVRVAFSDATTTIGAIRQAWRRGATLMADNAAAAAIGQSMTVDATPTDDSLEDDSLGDFLVKRVNVRDGRGFLAGVAIEPRLMPDRHWGRLYNLLYRDPGLLAIGIDVGTALEVTQAGAVVRGNSAVVALDGRYATFAVGSNGALGARWVVLNSYVAGDAVTP